MEISLDFKTPTPNQSLSPSEQLSIYQKHIGHFIIGKPMLSPLREEKNPSFSIYHMKGKYRWKDFGTGIGGDVYDLVAKMKGLNRNEVFEIINPISQRTDEEPIKYDIVETPYTEKGMEYWKQYDITSEDLTVGKIVFVNILRKTEGGKKKIVQIWRDNAPIYAYKYTRGNNHVNSIITGYCDDNVYYKILRPFSKCKWVSNLHGLWVDGYENLPQTGRTLFITKSRKDVVCLYHIRYPAISFNSESVNIDQQFIDLLKQRFENIIIFYDNDDAGICNAYRLSKALSLPSISIPMEFQSKDVSDMIKNHGTNTTKQFIENII